MSKDVPKPVLYIAYVIMALCVLAAIWSVAYSWRQSGEIKDAAQRQQFLLQQRDLMQNYLH